jgi:alanine racemase
VQRAVESQARANFLIHLKIDSGATRLGILPGELDQAIAELVRAPSLTVEGVCTLLVNAGDPQSPDIARRVVVFPAPFAPSTPTTSCSFTSRLSPLTA